MHRRQFYLAIDGVEQFWVVPVSQRLAAQARQFVALVETVSRGGSASPLTHGRILHQVVGRLSQGAHPGVGVGAGQRVTHGIETQAGVILVLVEPHRKLGERMPLSRRRRVVQPQPPWLPRERLVERSAPCGQRLATA